MHVFKNYTDPVDKNNTKSVEQRTENMQRATSALSAFVFGVVGSNI